MTTFSIGTGSTLASSPPSQRKRETPSSFATAPRRRQRDAEQGVRSERALVLGPVELDQALVERALIGGVHPADGRRDRLVDVRDGAQYALASVGRWIAVAELDRLVDARRGARGDGRPAERAAFEHDVDLDRRVPPRIEDLSRVHAVDGGQRSISFASS